MPELPDILVYLDALQSRIVNHPIEKIRLVSPFLVRTVDPDIFEFEGRTVTHLQRLGKRVVVRVEGDLYLVIHLMIAGRFRWGKRGAKVPGKVGLAAFDFPNGTLVMTEASPKKRAALYAVRGKAGLKEHQRGGVEVLDCDERTFRRVLMSENHTLKRSLTDPRLFSGVGNAYSDEILHAAGLSPVKWTSRLTDDEVSRLHRATIETLNLWIGRLREQFAKKFPGPGDITAFRPQFAVHGKFGEPCPVCKTIVQRVRYAQNETNYCPRCQTDGRLLADRSLSRLLREDWPRSIDE